MKKLTPAFVVAPFALLAICIHLTGDYAYGLVLTAVILTATILSVHAYYKRKRLKEDLNRAFSVHIVGMHPEHNTPPTMPDFAEDCEFVPHQDVNVVAEQWRQRLRDAKNRHNVQVYEYFLRQPITEDAAVESWSPEQGENNYPARVMAAVKKDRAFTHTRQYKAGEKAYRKVVAGQTINS